MSLSVRSAGLHDVPALTLLLNRIIQIGGTTALEDLLSEAEFADYFLNGAEALFCHLVESGGEPVGFQSISRHGVPNGWGDIATFARAEPKVPGVGTALFARSLTAARQQGLVAINAQIRADNVSGLAYYTKMGFQTYRTLEAVLLRDGRPVDRICKRYDLEAAN